MNDVGKRAESDDNGKVDSVRRREAVSQNPAYREAYYCPSPQEPMEAWFCSPPIHAVARSGTGTKPSSIGSLLSVQMVTGEVSPYKDV